MFYNGASASQPAFGQDVISMIVTPNVRLVLCIALAIGMVACCNRAPADDVVAKSETDSQAEFFERNVRPLLAEKCFSCHGRGQRKGKLGLDNREAILAGGESGPAVVEGDPKSSLLIEAVQQSGSLQMPPDARLSEREIAILKEWVSLGLPFPSKGSSGNAAIRANGVITEEDRQFWSFRPIENPPLPSMTDVDWPRGPIDLFVLKRLEEEDLAPVPEADRRTWIRRATFDLLGLPPDEEDVAAFVVDQREDAYQRVVDRLLASPHYGERWARHWLDVARYGEDQAHTFQARTYPNGFRYRDWIIESLNENLPIDQFLFHQIAGDLLPGERDERMRRLRALGFFSLGPVYYADAGCAPKAKADEYDDRIDTLVRGMLGLTVSCARCHDHKFDPISMQDYYALAGIFASTEYSEEPLAPPEQVKAYDLAQAEIKKSEQQLKEFESQLTREVAESFAPRTAEYMLAAWSVGYRRQKEADLKIIAVIEGSDLEELLVERWLQYLQSEDFKKISRFKAWHDLASDASDLTSLKSAAESVQSQLVSAIQLRHEISALTKDASSLLKALIDGNNAPLAIPKDRLDKWLSDESKMQLAATKQGIDQQKKAAPAKYPVVHAIAEGKPTNQKIHLRGNVNDLGDEVPRRFPAILAAASTGNFEQGSGRLELAKAIAHPQNPLTARVFVNRVWQHHFDRGIVSTPSNFGLLGVPPTHPELLDHLAARFISSGWSLKQLHRDIMLSATYRLASSGGSFQNETRDPDNRWLWRMNRRRLDIESMRDAALMFAGNLDLSVGGPSTKLEVNNNRRRTLYAAVSRHELDHVLRLFDFPDPNLTSERRSMTTVPMQQLFVLNSEFMINQSRALASRVDLQRSPSDQVTLDDSARIDRLYSWLFGRKPDENERRIGLAFVHSGEDDGVDPGEIRLSRWEQYAHALLSTNEFFFVD